MCYISIEHLCIVIFSWFVTAIRNQQIIVIMLKSILCLLIVIIMVGCESR